MHKKNDLNWKIKKSKEIISAADRKWSSNTAVAFTGGKDSTVVADLVKKTTKRPPKLFFIDHKLHFQQTYDFVNKISKAWKTKLLTESEPKALKKLQNEKKLSKKKELSRILKIETIKYAVAKHNLNSIYTGIRWDEHEARSTEKYLKKYKDHFRIHPILHFTEQDIWDYIHKFKLPYNPLYDEGYRSIGEKPFTKKVVSKGQSERDGREKEKEDIMQRLRNLGYF